MTRCRILFVGLVLLAPTRSIAALPEAPPEQVGLDPARLARIDEAVARAIDRREVPGAVVLVGRHGRIAFVRASGLRAVMPAAEPMTRDTVFDLASLTKPGATATSILILLDRGRLELEDRLGRLLPEFDDHGKGPITVEQLLRHRAGLVADDPLSDFADGPERPGSGSPGSTSSPGRGSGFLYSDVGFMILGRLVERLSGQQLDRFARAEVFEPLGMVDTGFRPDGQGPTPIGRVAPTETHGRIDLRGVVHDPRGRALGGGRGARGAVRHRRRSGGLCADAPRPWRGARRPPDPRPGDRPEDDRPGRHPRRPEARAGLGCRHRL
jgi:CubicO group peptidase (beta-lactamase class C family)